MVAGPETVVKNIQEYGIVTVSSQNSVTTVKPYGPLVLGGNDIWETGPGDTTAFYQILFDREYIVKHLIITWTKAPKLFEVKVMSEDG